MATYIKTLETYNLVQLQSEVNNTNQIVPSLLSVTADDDQITFNFAASLSSAEETALDGIIADHVPESAYIEVSELPFSSDTNKLAVQSSAKPIFTNQVTYAVWTGAGDNMDTGEIASGEQLTFDMTTGTSTKNIDVRFHPDNGRVWVNEAYIRVEGAGSGDWCDGYIMAPPSSLQQISDLDLIIEDNWVKYSPSGAGTGTHGFADTPVLCPRTFSHDGDWDYDGTNLTPNMTQTGDYKISDIEQTIHYFVQKIPLRGTSGTYFNLKSDDTTELTYPYFIRSIVHNVSDTNWTCQVFLEIYRERTVS